MFGITVLLAVHSRFSGSVNCGDPTMENSFEVAEFLFEAREASSLFVWSKMAQG